MCIAIHSSPNTSDRDADRRARDWLDRLLRDGERATGGSTPATVTATAPPATDPPPDSTVAVNVQARNQVQQHGGGRPPQAGQIRRSKGKKV